MGDNRPSVYINDEMDAVVYRASALGRCERALLHARIGRAPSPMPEKIQAAMDRSSELEDPIVEVLQAQFMIEVIERQREIIVEVQDGMLIRGSIDGVGRSFTGTVNATTGLVEIKAFGDSYWEKWLKGRMAAFPEYVTQFHVYLAGLRDQYRHNVDIAGWFEGGWFVVAHKDENGNLVTKNGAPDVRFEWVKFDPVVVAKAKARVRRVEDAFDSLQAGVRVEHELACDEAFGCPYWTLHEVKPAESNPDLALKLEAWVDADHDANIAKAKADALKNALGPVLQVAGESQKVMTKYGDISAVWVPPTEQRRLRKDVTVPDDWYEKTPKMGYVKITKPKGDK